MGSTNIWTVGFTALLIIMTLAVPVEGGESPDLPRITVRDGTFVEAGSGEQFEPRGFNYIRLYDEIGWHSTFAPGFYEPERAEAMLADLEAHGFNTVRVFIDHRAGSGVVDSEDAASLSEAYMANVVDFLRRARNHRVYVLPSLVSLPRTGPYRRGIDTERDRIMGHNQYYLQEGFIRAKCRYLKDFVRVIKEHEVALLSTVLAFELENETHFVSNQPPFSLTKDRLTAANGTTYDLSDRDDLQRMAEEHVRNWADACVNAIHSVDPDALVGTSVFTYRAIGRSGPGEVREGDSSDPRFPGRPVALARSKLSYVDIHTYPRSMDTLKHDLRSIEFEKLKRVCRRTGKPLLMGEFGAFKKFYSDLDSAAKTMEHYLKRVYNRGFDGFMYWTYDTDEQERLWNAQSGDRQIFRALRRMLKWRGPLEPTDGEEK